MAGLKEILKIVNNGSLLNTWHLNALSALESFLSNINALVQQQKLPVSPLAISYVKTASKSDDTKALTQLLASCFNQVGISTHLCPLEDAAKLNTQLDEAGYAVVLCTPEYAAKAGKNSSIWNVLDNFGKKKKNALHPLLCEGEFRDVALQIVDSHYLIRSIHAVLNQDPLIAIPALVDIVFHLSGSQGLGLLPDVLNIKETVNATAEAAYKEGFNALQISIQKYTIDYRLKASLEESIPHHSLISHPERPKTDKEVEGFLPSEAKVGLFFCQNKADTLLTSLHLSEILSKKSERVLTIDCAKYPGQASWDCVQKALKALQLKSADIEAMKKEPLIIVLNGYQDLGAYDNLWVKNALSTWSNVKLLVTCQADYFKERGYLRCFLADVSNRRVEDITVFSIPTFASLEAQMAALSINIRPDVNQEVEQFSLSDKRKAEYIELTRFLERLHQLWVGKDYLKSALHQNPKLFISYAWEEDKTEAGKKALGRQQMYLSRIAQDFKTVGIPTWLDTEQMSGDIDEQMGKNIAESHGVLVIETPRYIERSQQATNVKKEWDAIYAKSQSQTDFRVFPIQYSPQTSQANQTLTITSFLANHANRCDFSQIDDDYVLSMTHPESGLIARWLCDTPEKKALYQNAYEIFQQELQLLVGKHLIVNQDQADVLGFDMPNRLKGYIAPFGLYTEESPMDSRFDLVKYFADFLNKPECKTAIVLGRAGSGKSLFSLSTFRQLLQPWITYQSIHQERPQWLPIYIQLRNYAQQPEHAIQNALKQQFRLTDADIAALKQGLNHQQQILFILDGYDELGSGIRPNYTEALKDWAQAKLLITSRPEHFDKDHQPLDALTLKLADGRVLFSSAQEVHISPFSCDEIEQYIENYEEQKIPDVNVLSQDLSKKIEKCDKNQEIQEDKRSENNDKGPRVNNTYQLLKNLPGMMALLDNPFLLTLVLQSLPQLLENYQSFQARNIMRVDIYKAFTQTWFLQETQGRELSPEACQTFCEELAFRLFSARTISLSDIPTKKDLWTFFNHPNHRAPQDASPIRFSGSEYCFIHKSVYGYFVAKRLWRAILEPDCVNFWKTRMLTEEQFIIDFLAEIFKNEHSSNEEKRLFELILASRDADFSEITSGNAATLLNAARIPFSGKDLSRIRIPNANLSGAILDATSLAGADLTGVNLSGAWLQETNFYQAHMMNVILEEYPGFSFKDEVFSCCYSPDSRFLAMAVGKEIRLFDAITRTLLHSFKAHTKTVTSVAFSPDGRLLATGSDDNTAKLWWVEVSIFQTALHKRLEKHTANVLSVAFSPNGQLLATSSEDRSVKLWQVASGALKKTLEVNFSGLDDKVNSIAFSPDGQILATGRKRTVDLWEVATGILLKQLNAGYTYSVSSVAFSPDGQVLATVWNNTAYLWQVSSWTVKKTLQGHTSNVLSVVFSSDGQLLATCSGDKTAKLWQPASGMLLKTLEGHIDSVNSVAFSPDGQVLATGSSDRTARLWQVTSSVLQKMPEGHSDSVVSVAFSPDGRVLATGSHDSTAKLWQTRNGILQKTLEGHTDHVNSVAFSPDGQILTTGSSDETTKLWRLPEGIVQTTLEDDHWVKNATFSPDGRVLATVTYGYMVDLWEVLSGSLKGIDTWHTGNGGGYLIIYAGNPGIAFSPDGQLLATGSPDNTAKLWQVPSRTLYKTLEGHTSGVTSLAFSPNGRVLATGSGDKTVKLWQVGNGTLQKTLLGHTLSVISTVFSPDGQMLGTGSEDNTIRLWLDFERSQEPLVSITQVSSIPNAIAFYQKNQDTFLASGHHDHSVRYWQLVQKNNQPYLQLLWTTHQNTLLASKACIEGTKGLSQNNLDLFIQGGAIGKPLMLSDAGKIASGSNTNASSSSQSSNNFQNRNEDQKGIEESKKDCKIM